MSDYSIGRPYYYGGFCVISVWRGPAFVGELHASGLYRRNQSEYFAARLAAWGVAEAEVPALAAACFDLFEEHSS